MCRARVPYQPQYHAARRSEGLQHTPFHRVSQSREALLQHIPEEQLGHFPVTVTTCLQRMVTQV